MTTSSYGFKKHWAERAGTETWGGEEGDGKAESGTENKTDTSWSWQNRQKLKANRDEQKIPKLPGKEKSIFPNQLKRSRVCHLPHPRPAHFTENSTLIWKYRSSTAVTWREGTKHFTWTFSQEVTEKYTKRNNLRVETVKPSPVQYHQQNEALFKMEEETNNTPLDFAVNWNLLCISEWCGSYKEERN